MNLIEFAKTAKDDVSPEDFVAKMKEILPLDEVKNLTEEEGLMFFSAVSWLHDLGLLLIEFNEQDGEMPSPDGQRMAPCIPGTHGPFIDTVLTRGRDEPDFSPLVNFGLE
ncbi:hypothetical protein [Marinibacterium profundimaris]|uniref:Uncharacterized protein n=1 Tax=Marinibacterium profundimaris TaxID=1679460 RepID=A0A225NBD7_9RHOB|nr:hypothetical protein [Marinibacterium profundimaris]OWU67791.1 hypothetical protein ATO3_25515 [Marinibacterium profundimaris]